MAGVAQSHIYRLCVAGVAQPDIHLRFTWQAWHNLTSTVFAWQAWHNLTSTFVSRGRRGTISHLPSFCVAGVALIPTYLPTYLHTYIHTYMHTYHFTFSIFHHLLCLSFPVPAKTIEAHFRKKLTCGVIRSFNSSDLFFGQDVTVRGELLESKYTCACCLAVHV